MTEEIDTELNNLIAVIENLSKKIDDIEAIKHVSVKMDSINAIQDVSKKIDDNNIILESKIDNLPKTLADTCAIQAKWVLWCLVPAMTLYPLLLVGLMVWGVWKCKRIEVHEAWFLCIIFIGFYAFAVMLTRILVRRDD